MVEQRGTDGKDVDLARVNDADERVAHHDDVQVGG